MATASKGASVRQSDSEPVVDATKQLPQNPEPQKALLLAMNLVTIQQ